MRIFQSKSPKWLDHLIRRPVVMTRLFPVRRCRLKDPNHAEAS
jgi:hypothetical protein